MKIDPISLHVESQILRCLERGKKQIHVVGSSPFQIAAALLTQQKQSTLSQLPHLVVVPSDQELESFLTAAQAFNPETHPIVCPHWDLTPFSGVTPHRRLSAQRIAFLWRLHSAKPGEIFLISYRSLLQKTLPFASLQKFQFRLRTGFDLPENFYQTLADWGYEQSPLVEDLGTFARRGGVVDVFSPNSSNPIRIELFGDTVQSMRFFAIEDQRGLGDVEDFVVLPCRETVWTDASQEHFIEKWRQSLTEREVESHSIDEIVRSANRRSSFEGIEFSLQYFYSSPGQVLDHCNQEFFWWALESEDGWKNFELFREKALEERADGSSQAIWPNFQDVYWNPETVDLTFSKAQIFWSNLDSSLNQELETLQVPSRSVREFTDALSAKGFASNEWISFLKERFLQWKKEGQTIFVFCPTQNQIERMRNVLEKAEIPCLVCPENSASWAEWKFEQEGSPLLVHLIQSPIGQSERWIDDSLCLLRSEELLGKMGKARKTSAQNFEDRAKWLSFGDLKPGDCVVHVQHGIGRYEGLKVLSLQGVESELLQVSYRDNDKLYLPVYRLNQIQKYSGLLAQFQLDKLGGATWEKTTQKVKTGIRDIARELLVLYAERKAQNRIPFPIDELELTRFENAFPYEETEDQHRAIQDVLNDLRGTQPMDRLVCGDVGFGKTEVALRAAFACVSAGKQVAILAPTTVLTFQHDETFRKRFHKWPIQIQTLNRFLSSQNSKKALAEIKSGACQVVIGTHRLLSKDVVFKDLGLLIVDEEQKFGVAHKEKIRKIKKGVDTVALSATPIPRTLNLSLLGIRDLSLITTAPVDRLPTRTFVSRWNDDMIRKAILAEMNRGGQIFFIHNRIQSIERVREELSLLVPEARIRVGHGQMDEDLLEKTMVDFFHHEIDILLCTAIVESGIDNPRANTMFIDQAHQMGLSQLYQLRGRVGRSKQRAFCYLLMPKDRNLDAEAQQRLKILQDNTALGSGIRVAQYDLELRGAGEILGENQSGHIDAVGFELYQELLRDTLFELKGEKSATQVEPEINLRIPALIPSNYIADVRLRLAFYKAMNAIENTEDLDRIEADLRDQFGQLPEPTVNLLGLMLIRSVCKKLFIKDLSCGLKNLSLIFTQDTPLKTETIVRLASKENKKYSLSPDQRLNIRLNNLSWPNVYDELLLLEKLAGS